MVKSVRSLARGLAVIEALAAASSLSLAEVQAATDLPKATVLRSLQTLMEQGWVYRGLGDGRYRLRARLRIRSAVPESYEQLVELGGPVLERLQERTGWPSDIAVRAQTRMRILETSRRVSFARNHDLMDFQPHILWSALGRAYLAYCPQAERAELLVALRRSKDRRDKAVDSERWLERLVRETQARGYAVRDDSYWVHPTPMPGPPVAIAVPIVQGECVLGTINLVWPRPVMDTSTAAERYLDALKEAAADLAAQS